jgi:hypothetical protein
MSSDINARDRFAASIVSALRPSIAAENARNW